MAPKKVPTPTQNTIYFSKSSKVPTFTLKYIKIFKVNYLIIHPAPSKPKLLFL